ncbi:MAG: TetR/AcrR family transcriptional regulator [Pseudomonadota bacterium]
MLQTHNKSSQTQQTILEAASKILIEQGYNGFTLRKVASAAKISIGNLNYHYPTKVELIDALLEHITQRIIEGFTVVSAQAGDSPEDRFRAVLDYWINDLQTIETTVFFPEIWSLSNHHEFARQTAASSYAHAKDILETLVRDLNPDLTEDLVEQLAMFMCASLEGLTVFIGHKKMWQSSHEEVKKLAIDNLINAARNAKAAT